MLIGTPLRVSEGVRATLRIESAHDTPNSSIGGVARCDSAARGGLDALRPGHEATGYDINKSTRRRRKRQEPDPSAPRFV